MTDIWVDYNFITEGLKTFGKKTQKFLENRINYGPHIVRSKL